METFQVERVSVDVAQIKMVLEFLPAIEPDRLIRFDCIRHVHGGELRLDLQRRSGIEEGFYKMPLSR